ncbi:MAG: TatD family hydrolase [Saprospiraceae bacterium]
MDYPYIDFHTHSRLYQDDVIEVVSLHRDQIKDVKYYTVGHHPWWSEHRLSPGLLGSLADKYTNDSYCLGIGECGLDLLRGKDLDLQEEIFIQQVELANRLNAPVVVHCVRAYDRIIRLRQKYGHTPWVVHGYVRNKILGQQLVDNGFYLSMAPSIEIKQTFVDTLKFVPLDKMFLETDRDFSIGIMERYAFFAQLRGMDIIDLRCQMYQNFISFYKEKWKYHHG